MRAVGSFARIIDYLDEMQLAIGRSRGNNEMVREEVALHDGFVSTSITRGKKLPKCLLTAISRPQNETI